MKIQKMGQGFGRILCFAALLLAATALSRPASAEQIAQYQTSTPPATKPVEVAPPAPASPASPSTTAPTTPSTSGSAPDSGSGLGVPGLPDDATTQTLDVPSRPTAVLHAKSDWDSGFKSIHASLATIQSEMAKAGLKQGGKPLAVFVETGDSGFTYDAMVPLAQLPDDKVKLGGDVTIGSSPAGKAIKFQHRGSYDDIDSTYDLITAYLDEKGLEAQNLFIEEYLTDTKSSDDQGLEVDIYVFIK